MEVDPDRSITITMPFGMIYQLKKAQPILAMFRDEGDVRAVIEIIDAIYSGALEYIREEEGEIKEVLGTGSDENGNYFLVEDDEDEKKN